MYGNDGPLWYRGWALESDNEVCSSVDDVLEKTGVRRMIMGHTPDFQVGCLSSWFIAADPFRAENRFQV
jgi:hypothetical protein